MKNKIAITVEKTIEALARIQRFVVKFGPELSKAQKGSIAEKLKGLQQSLRKLK